jgi:hypothetical protein
LVTISVFFEDAKKGNERVIDKSEGTEVKPRSLSTTEKKDAAPHSASSSKKHNKV